MAVNNLWPEVSAYPAIKDKTNGSNSQVCKHLQWGQTHNRYANIRSTTDDDDDHDDNHDEDDDELEW